MPRMSFFNRRNEHKRASLRLPREDRTWSETINRGVPIYKHWAWDERQPDREVRRKRIGFFRRWWDKLTRRQGSGFSEEEEYLRRHGSVPLDARRKCCSLPDPNNVRLSQGYPVVFSRNRCSATHLSNAALHGYPSEASLPNHCHSGAAFGHPVCQTARGSAHGSRRSIASCSRLGAQRGSMTHSIAHGVKPINCRPHAYVLTAESEVGHNFCSGSQRRSLSLSSPPLQHSIELSSSVCRHSCQRLPALPSSTRQDQGLRTGPQDNCTCSKNCSAGAIPRQPALPIPPQAPTPEYCNFDSNRRLGRFRPQSALYDTPTCDPPDETCFVPERPAFRTRSSRERIASSRNTSSGIEDAELDSSITERPVCRTTESGLRPRSAVLPENQVAIPESVLCVRCRSVVITESQTQAEGILLPPRIVEPVDVRLCSVVRQTKIRTLTEELNAIAMYGWYWGPISRTDAEEKLRDQPDGTFLVRDSSDDFLVLSLYVRSVGKTLFVRIEYGNGKYSFQSRDVSKWHPSVVSLIEYSMKVSQFRAVCYTKPQTPNSLSYPVRLTKPVSRFNEVRSLQYLCRFVIRYSTRVDLIDKLPLPKLLLGYIEESCF